MFYSNDKLSNLKRMSPPNDMTMIYDTYAIEFKAEITLPSWDSICVDNHGFNQFELDLYINLLDEVESLFKKSDEEIHRLLGYPNAIQGDMQLECQLVTNGLNCGDASAYNNPLRYKLEKGAEDWVLLLQVDSIKETMMMWGDEGRIYFWIREDDLKKCLFDNTWLILQCG